MDAWADEPPDDWSEPDESWETDAYIEDQRRIESREPFTFHDEHDRTVAAAFRGDHDVSAYYDGRERGRRESDAHFWSNVGAVDPLTHAHLHKLRLLDAATDCNEDDCDPDADSARGLSIEERRRLWAIGRRLHERDNTFWRRLRRFGATPSLIPAANEVLFPPGVPSETRCGLRRPVPTPRRCVARRQSRRGNRRQRRSIRQRSVRSSARSGDSGDGSEGEPARRGGLASERRVVRAAARGLA